MVAVVSDAKHIKLNSENFDTQENVETQQQLRNLYIIDKLPLVSVYL